MPRPHSTKLACCIFFSSLFAAGLAVAADPVLLENTAEIVDKPQGFGDAAVLFQEDGLFKLRCVVRTTYAVEAVATDAESAKKLMRHALAALSR